MQDGANWNYYDSNGKKVIKDTIDDGGKYYYFDDNGNLAIERWVDLNGKTFYVNKDGVVLKNQWVGDYYVGNDGNVLKNTTTPDGYMVGSDGRYIVETKQSIPQTIIIRETVPVTIPPTEVTTIYSTNQSYIVIDGNPSNIATSEYGTNIIEPTAEVQGISNVIENENTNYSDKSNNYILKSANNYRQKTYLSNDRTCSINVLIPTLIDKDGNECIAFKEGIMQEQDNIVSELIDLADSSIEESTDGDGYTSTKYISSISFNEARIIAQDDYALTVREVGKCNWNKGKEQK